MSRSTTPGPAPSSRLHKCGRRLRYCLATIRSGAGGGVPQRVLAGHGQGSHHDVVGGGHVRAKTR
jgi:hypothetical protein